MTGAEIKAMRERRDWSQQDLADEIGVSVRSVCGWENGEHAPRARWVLRRLEELGRGK